MKKICLLFTVMAMFFTALSASAQNVVVTGTIVDSSNGETIAGASVMVKDTRIGTSADADGKYSISVPAGSKDNAVVVFSFVGYKTQEVALNGKTVLNCKLQPDATVLEDVVVVGYGTAKKVGSLVGSVTTVKSEAIKNAPSSSALDQLQGQVAGMSVLTSGGVAGDNNVSIKIHGTGTLSSSSEPLYVIDGMQSSSRTIMSMNPNDILSISVLKDASATSIYGSRAANGVVYITTKAGSYDNKATVTIRSQAGISTIADMTLYKNMMSGPELKEFWAVNDVSFSLEEGDLLGIVGSNGAGKSTLLKVISGIMCPTTGKMSVEGTIASLLELGTGFDGELTVRENTFLRGAMLGYTREFMNQKYEEIIDFSGLGEFRSHRQSH